MHLRTSLVAALAMLGTALAGCSSDGSGEAIEIEALGTDGGPGPYRFTANVESDNGNYTWDLGDRATVKYGAEVEHTYDLKDANLTVTLRVGSAQQPYTANLVLGTGRNAKPTFLLHGETDWAVVGQPVTFSAARSTDPDGDPGRYGWSCARIGEAVRQDFHEHVPVGDPYQTSSAGTVNSAKANFTLPPPDLVIPGDLCETLADGMQLTPGAATIQGTLSRPGKYRIYLLASDGANPTVSGSYEFFATPAGEKPAPVQTFRFEGTLQAGADGGLQAICSQLPQPQQCDVATHRFELGLAGLGAWVNVTHDGGAAGAVANVTWELWRNGSYVTESVSPSSRLLEARDLRTGTYELRMVLQRGATATYQADVTVQLNMDPYTVY